MAVQSSVLRICGPKYFQLLWQEHYTELQQVHQIGCWIVSSVKSWIRTCWHAHCAGISSQALWTRTRFSHHAVCYSRKHYPSPADSFQVCFLCTCVETITQLRCNFATFEKNPIWTCHSLFVKQFSEKELQVWIFLKSIKVGLLKSEECSFAESQNIHMKNLFHAARNISVQVWLLLDGHKKMLCKIKLEVCWTQVCNKPLLWCHVSESIVTPSHTRTRCFEQLHQRKRVSAANGLKSDRSRVRSMTP